MNNIFLALLTCLPLILFAQNQDSVAVAQEVDSLLQVCRSLTAQQKFEEAIRMIEETKWKAGAGLSKAGVAYASCLYNHGRILHIMGKYAEAEPLYLEALDIRNKILGKEHPDIAQSLNNLAVLYVSRGEFDKAESFHIEAKDIRARVLGKEHPDYAQSLSNLANLYYFMGQFAKAETFHLESMDIRAKILGTGHPNYAESLFNLATLYLDMGEYVKAESLCLEAQGIWEKAFGKGDSDYAKSLSILANIYKEMGQYVKAESLYLEAKNIHAKVLGKEHPDYATYLNNLSILYQVRGEYAKAELLYIESKNIRAKALGKAHPDYAASLNNLASLYADMGQYAKAEPLYLEAKDIWAITVGRENPDYALSLYNLSILYSALKEYAKAEIFAIGAKDIRAKTLGIEHPYYITTLVNLASLYYHMGKYANAESLFLEAKHLWAKTLNKEHPYYADILNSFASLHYVTGAYMQAESLYIEAKDIRVKVLGKDHPAYIASLNNLTTLYWQISRPMLVVPLIIEASHIHRNLLHNRAQHLSERDLSEYNKAYETYHNVYSSFAQVAGSTSGVMSAICFDNTLFYNGFLLKTVNQIKRLALTDTNAEKRYTELTLFHRRLVKEYAKPIVERDSLHIADWEEKANTLEKDLVRIVSGYGDLVLDVSWQNVRQRLQTGEAAIEFISYRYYTPNPTDSTMYAALILLPTDTTPHFIPLFEERQLHALLDNPALSEKTILKELYGARSELRRLLWQPLEPLLRDVKTVYYSPSGLLHRINPAALLDKSNQPLSANRQWVRVGSTRDLVTDSLADRSFAYMTASSKYTQSALIYGGIQYDMDSLAFIAANPPEMEDHDPMFQRKDGNFRYIVEEQSSDTPSGKRGSEKDAWESLTGSAREAEQIDALLRRAGFRSAFQMGFGASEERIKKIGKNGPSPRILHLATHGFAYPDPPKVLPKGFADSEPTFKLLDDPMLRSGLVLAGANHYWKNKRPLANREDGVLVAYEVRDLNLRNTELAVLSACQTGLGDVVGSEGVYGLQRAFRIAGAKFLIVSLWKVPDAQTQQLMRLFYENWLEKQESLRDAFNHAQQTLREKEPNPYMWAGFVLVE